MVEMNVTEVQEQLRQIRESQGDAAYITARDAIVKMLIHQPRGADFLKMAFPDLDLEPFQNADHDLPPNLADALKAKTPHVKTQVQLQLLVTGSEAFLLAMDSLFAGNKEQATKAIDAVMQCLEMAEHSQILSDQVETIPTEERGTATSAFVAPVENSPFQSLMADLALINTREALDGWYRASRSEIDRVVDSKSRNTLFDTIREKKAALSN